MSGFESNNRSRSRSPNNNTGRWNLKYDEGTSRQRLGRHEGAKRNTQPAWMTKGMGIGTQMFGEPKGIIKPGDKPGESAASPACQQAKDDYDPMGDVFRAAALEKEEEELKKEIDELKKQNDVKTGVKEARTPATVTPTTTATPTPTDSPAQSPPRKESPTPAKGASDPAVDDFLEKFKQAAGDSA